LTSTSIGFFAWPLASDRTFRAAIACFVAGESVFASTATIAGDDVAVREGVLDALDRVHGRCAAGQRLEPLCAVCSLNAGSASTSSNPPASTAAAADVRASA
jgi:hypothetical protein